MLCIALKADSAGDSLQGQSFLPSPDSGLCRLAHMNFELSNEDPRISRPCKPCAGHSMRASMNWWNEDVIALIANCDEL